MTVENWNMEKIINNSLTKKGRSDITLLPGIKRKSSLLKAKLTVIVCHLLCIMAA